MYKKFRKVVEDIIKKYSNEEAGDFFSKDIKLKVKKPSFLDFSIEKCGDILFIGYYTKKNGDLISDPIFVFEVKEDVWYPIRLEQWIGDTFIGKFDIIDGKEVYRYRSKTNSDVKSFATQCSNEWNEYYLKNDCCTEIISI